MIFVIVWINYDTVSADGNQAITVHTMPPQALIANH
jgi:hypothetical protein